jgi:1,2-diacylglycerol 3-beta-glucosyltransferase
LAMPPLSTLSLLAGLGSGGVAIGVAFHWLNPLALIPWLSADVGLLGYVLRGWAISGVGRRGLLDLAWAPLFIAWKLVRVGGRVRPSTWVRTARDRR